MSAVPTVSVLISAYNHEQYIAACLESVLVQTWRDFEVILVDDGSSDSTLDIARMYESRYPSDLCVLTHFGHVNRGITPTCNFAFEHCRGKYLAWIGSDDVWYPNHLQSLVELLDPNPQFGLVYGRADIIDANGEKVNLETLDGFFREDFAMDLTRLDDPLARLIQGNVVPAMAMMFRRECLDRLGPLDESVLYSDWEFFVRVLAHWDFGFIDRPLAMYRLHGNNTSVGPSDMEQTARGIAVLKALIAKAPQIGGRLALPSYQAKLEISLATYHKRHENAAAATRLSERPLNSLT